MYGKSRFRKNTIRTTLRRYSGRGSRYQKYVRTTKKPRVKFALAAYTKNIEKKYFDKCLQSKVDESFTGNGDATASDPKNGISTASVGWNAYTFGGRGPLSPPTVSNDLLKGIANGAGVRTRIGNKINVKYVKGSITVSAGQVKPAGMGMGILNQGGEMVIGHQENVDAAYLRTTIRVAIVKDLQVNSTTTNVKWHDVFEGGPNQHGVHSELNVDNMGRFFVLWERSLQLDADDPQKTLPYMISGSKVGPVRYNGGTAEALTDKGLYVIWSSFTIGMSSPLDTYLEPSLVMNGRVCFTDD